MAPINRRPTQPRSWQKKHDSSNQGSLTDRETDRTLTVPYLFGRCKISKRRDEDSSRRPRPTDKVPLLLQQSSTNRRGLRVAAVDGRTRIMKRKLGAPKSQISKSRNGSSCDENGNIMVHNNKSGHNAKSNHKPMTIRECKKYSSCPSFPNASADRIKKMKKEKD